MGNLKENDLINLRNGDRITLRNGDVLVFDEYYGRIVNAEDSRINYNANLTHKSRKELDIVEVKRPVEYATIFTEEDRIIDDDDLNDVNDDVVGALNSAIEALTFVANTLKNK